MSLSIQFFVPGVPKPSGSKRGIPIYRKGRVFTGHVAVIDACAGSKDWKADVKGIAQARWQDACVVTEPVKLTLQFFISRPKSHYRTGANSHLLRDGAPCKPIFKPDVLKLARAVEDALTGVIWHDDAQITTELLGKQYAAHGSQPGVSIYITADA